MFRAENEFDEIIKEHWKNPVLDGITNLNNYKKSKYKILWILKEANKSGGNDEEWVHREFHKNVTQYTRWWATYKKIIYVSYGILHNNYDWDSIPDVDKGTERIDGKCILEDIAIININKSGGGSTSSQSMINKHYREKRKILLQQIDGIEPDIIINASRCEDLFKDIAQESRISTLSNSSLKYFVTNNRLVMNYYHPASRFPTHKYCNDLLYTAKIMWCNKQ